MKNKNQSTFRLAFAAILLAVVIVMQLLKNISAYISGPVINAVLVVAMLELGTWYGLGFAVLVPVLSLLIAPASPMTMLGAATGYVTVPMIAAGNMIFCFSAKLGRGRGKAAWVASLIVGAVLKWLFLLGCADWILLPVFSQALGALSAVVTKVFSVLQLYSGLLSIVLILPVEAAIRRLHKHQKE